MHKNILDQKIYLLLLMVLNVAVGYSQVEFPGEPTQQDTRSCGRAVLDYLATHYFVSEAEIQLPENEVSMNEMLVWSRKLNPGARAVDITGVDFADVPVPAILHLSSGHYILLKRHDDNGFAVYDPAALHIAKVSRSYLDYFSSRKAIIFTDNSTLPLLGLTETETAKGSFAHEFPPPNQTEDGYHRGRSPYNRPQGECRNNRSRRGSPLFSFNPVILNVLLEDAPMWYDAGVGPDFELALTYNSNDHQEVNGGAGYNTQYFPFGKRWSFSYGSFYTEISGNEILIIMPDGAREKFTWDNGAFVPSHTDNYDRLERYSVLGGYGYCLIQKDTRLKYWYDNPAHNKLTSIEDPNGNVVTLNYDFNYNLTSVTDANGRSVTFTLNQYGRIIQATDPMGRTAQFEYGYTDNEFLTGITDMGGYSSTLEYDEVQVVSQSGYTMESQVVSVTTPTGTTNLTWTATGSIGPGKMAFYWTFTNPDGVSATTYFSYGEATQGIIKMADNNGNFDIIYVDLPNYRVTHIEKPDPEASVFYGYDANGNINSIAVGWFENHFLYDASGNLIQFDDARGKSYLFEYDENDNLIGHTDPMNRTVTYEYDEHYNVIRMITPVNEIQFSYYPDGNLQSFTDGNQNTVTYDYDALGYLTQINYPLGVEETMTNDEAGRITGYTNRGITIQYEYDDLDQVTQLTYPDGTQTKYTYQFQNLIQFTDRINRKVDFEYDGMNQMIKVQGPQGLLDIIRDGNGNITRISVNGKSNYYTYDKMDRVIAEIDAQGRTRHLTYNENGDVLTFINENGDLITYSYDFDLLTNIDFSDDTPDVSITYNDDGEVTEITDGEGTLTYTYDAGGRLTGISGNGKEGGFTFTYDSAYNRKTMSMDGLTVQYSYDALNRLTGVESNYAGASYTFNDRGLLSHISYDNGSFTEMTYDEMNRMISQIHKKSTGEIIAGFNYTYKNPFLISKIEDFIGITSKYDYDFAGQLISEKVIDQQGKTLWENEFSYDIYGNRTKIIKNGVSDYYSYNSLNQLGALTKTVVSASGIIDGDSSANVYVGNIKAKTAYLGNNRLSFRANDIPLEYFKDTMLLYARANDQLATVGDSSEFVCTTQKLPNGDININLFSDTENVSPENINTIYIKKDLIHYVYDDNGNLIKRLSPTDTTLYFYDAENRLVRIVLPGGDTQEFSYDAYGQCVEILRNGNLFKRFVYDGRYEAVSVTDSMGNTRYITRGLSYPGGIAGLVGIYDAENGNITNYFNIRGDLIAGTDSDEEIFYTRQYNAFGNEMSSTGVPNSDFGFSSKVLDAEAGLYNFGARYYSLAENRWLTKDPLGFAAGLNLYGFVGNNPVTNIDPDGQFFFTALAIIGAVSTLYGLYKAGKAAKRLADRAQENLRDQERSHSIDEMIDYEKRRRQRFLKSGKDIADIVSGVPGTFATGTVPGSREDLIVVGALYVTGKAGEKADQYRRRHRRRGCR